MKNKYYLIARPAMPGTLPKKGLVEIENYDSRRWIPEANCNAWAAVWYDRELTEQELNDYEMTAEGST